MSEELKNILEGVETINFCRKLEGHEALLREFPWEAYDIGYDGTLRYDTLSDLREGGLFDFNELLARVIDKRELYMVNVEKLAFVQYAKREDLRKASLIYILHSMQLCLQDEKLVRSSTLVDGLGVVLSATSCLIETITTGDAADSVEDGVLLASMVDILDIVMLFARGLAAKSLKWSAKIRHASVKPLWYSKAADDIAGFTLNLVSHFVSTIPDESTRSNTMSMAVEVLHLLCIDLSRLTSVPRSMRAFLYSSKVYHATAFDEISQLERVESDDRPEDDAVAIAKGMKLGLCGSGLDDRSQMSHLTGLERALFAHHTDEQKELLVAYACACFDEEEDAKGSNREGEFGMGKVDMVPWRAVSDRSVREQVEGWQNLLEEMKNSGINNVAGRAITRLVQEAATKRFPGAHEVEAACWPLLGCALAVSHSLAPPTGTQGSYSYPVCVFSQWYMYQDLEPLLFPLLSHPRTAAAEGLSVSTALGQLLPVPGGRSASRGGGGAAEKQWLLPGYTYLGSATGIDTNGYSVEEGSQATSRPWERQGQLRKRAFGVNAVVSHVAWREKERLAKQQSSPAANAARGSRGRSDDLLCVGQLCAASTDSHFLVQACVSAIVQAPNEQRAQAAFLALQKRLALFEPRGLSVLLRRLIQECPYSNVTGLLVDVVKACAQHSSRGGGAEGWHFPTKLSVRVDRQMRRSSPASHSAKLFRQISKAPLPSFLPQMNELVALEKGEEQKDSGGQPTKQRELGEEAFFLAWRDPPFWSPFWVSTLASSSLQMLASESSAEVEHELDAIAASVALLMHTVQRLQASKRALGAEMAARGVVPPGNEHFMCLRSYLLPYDPSIGGGDEDLSASSLLGSLQRNKDRLFGPLLEQLEDASFSLEGLVSRREKGPGVDTATLLRLQVLSMNIQSICNLLDTW